MNRERMSHVDREPRKQEEEPVESAALSDFRAVVFDRLRAQDISAEPPKDIRLPEIPPENAENFNAILRLTRALNGHRGSASRQLLREPGSTAAEQLAKIMEEWPSDPNEGIGELAQAKPPELLAQDASPTEIYEHLAFAETHPLTTSATFNSDVSTAAALAMGMDEEAATEQVTGAIFTGGGRKAIAPIRTMLEKVGFVPAIYGGQAAIRELPPQAVADAIFALRELQIDKSVGAAARTERSRLIDAFIASDLLKKAAGEKETPATIDARGLWLNVPGVKMHDHLPYGLVSDAAEKALAEGGMLSGDQLLELAVRRADENAEPEALHEAREAQMSAFAEAYGSRQKLEEDAQNNPEAVARFCIEKKLTVPDEVLALMLSERTPQAAHTVLRFAESVQAQLSKEKITREPQMMASHQLLGRKKETYEARENTLHDPRAYSAGKALRKLFSAEVPPSDPDKRYLAFRGGYRDSKDGRHVFVESVLNGQATRVLVEPEATLGGARVANLEKLPNFPRSVYEPLEDAVRTFDYYTRTVAALPKTLDMQRPGWEKQYAELADSALHFLLSNVSEKHHEAAIEYRRMRKQDGSLDLDAVSWFHRHTRDAAEQYGRFLYENASTPERFEQKFSPEIKKMDIAFGRDFVNDALGRVADDGMDVVLSERAQPVRVVTMFYRQYDPTETIPYHVELSALNALRLNPERPLINVLGGARYVDKPKGTGIDPMERVAVSVLNVGHELQANIAVPGTQSGLGLAFGYENMHYLNQVEDIPRAEKAHLFAVTPAGHTYFPGNEKLVGEPAQTYAINAVDSILTPFPAGWDDKPETYRKSPYHNHIAYMESLFERLSHGQPKALVVANGGFWTMLEANVSLKRGFDFLLIKGTGRFADAAAQTLESLDDARLSRMTDAELDAAVLEIVGGGMEVVGASRLLTQDFGEKPAPADERESLYREQFRNFIREASKNRDRVRVTTLDTLEADLKAMLAAKPESPAAKGPAKKKK